MMAARSEWGAMVAQAFGRRVLASCYDGQPSRQVARHAMRVLRKAAARGNRRRHKVRSLRHAAGTVVERIG